MKFRRIGAVMLLTAIFIESICATGTVKADGQQPVSTSVEHGSQNQTIQDPGTRGIGVVPGDAGYVQPVPETTAAPVIDVTPVPEVVSEPDTGQAAKVTCTPAVKKVENVNLRRYSTGSFKIRWNRVKRAKFYHIYISKKRDGKFRLAGTTKNTWFRLKKLKKDKDYYVYVTAGLKKKVTDYDSKASRIKHIKTKEYRRKTIFAGDSITQEIAIGDTISRMKIGGRTKVVAAVGLNTITFHTKRVFSGGRSALSKVISEKPYRVYMMIGINEIHYRPSSLMIDEYTELINAIHEGSPNTDIVLCAVSPVTRSEKSRAPGYWQIPVFNKKLKKLAKKKNCRYWDYTDFLKDSEGYLKLKYASADGYHWKRNVYAIFADKVHDYEKSIDG